MANHDLPSVEGPAADLVLRLDGVVDGTFSGAFVVGGDAIPVGGGSSVPGLCFDDGSVCGRDSHWTFRLLWFLARRRDEGIGSGPVLALREWAKADELIRIPSKRTGSGTHKKGTLEEYLQKFRAGERGKVRRIASRFIEVDVHEGGYRARLQRGIHVALVATEFSPEAANRVVLGELADVFVDVVGLDPRSSGTDRSPDDRSGVGAVAGSSARLTAGSSGQARIAGAEHARDRLPPFDVQRKTDGLTLVDVAIRAGQKPGIVAIVGDAGLGKSATLAAAFLRWTAEDGWGTFAQCALDAEEWAASPDAQLDDLLGGPTRSWIEMATADGKVPAVFFDTLDMISGPRTATAIVRSLVALVHAGARVFVSCRTTEMTQVQHALRSMSRSCDSTRIDLPRFGASEIAEFVKRFTEARSDVPHVDEFVAGITELADRPQMAAVLGVPLLLSMTCGVYCGRGEIPQNLTLRGLYDAVYNDKVCKARSSIGRSDTPLLRMNACARVGTELLERSTDRLQLSTDGVADWILAPGVADALVSLVSEVVLVHPRADSLEFFHQSFTEYLVGRLIHNEERYWRTYTRLYCDDPSRYYWLAPVLKFALAHGGEARIREALATFPLDHDGVFQTVVFAMVTGAPSLLPTLFKPDAPEGQRIALAEALDQLGDDCGFDLSAALLQLVHTEHEDGASTIAVCALASRVRFAPSPARQAVLLLDAVRTRAPNLRYLEARFVSVLARDPRSEHALVLLGDRMASLGDTSREQVSGAVARHGTMADVERAIAGLRKIKFESDHIDEFADLVARKLAHDLEVLGSKPVEVIVSAFVDGHRHHKTWRPVVARAAARAIGRARASAFAVDCAAYVASRQVHSDGVQIVLRALATETSPDLVWEAIRSVPNWWSTRGATSLALVLAEQLSVASELSVESLTELEREALGTASSYAARKHINPVVRTWRDVELVLYDLHSRRPDVAKAAMGELCAYVAAVDGADAMDLFSRTLDAPHLGARQKALEQLSRLLRTDGKYRAEYERLFVRISELATASSDPGEFVLAVAVRSLVRRTVWEHAGAVREEIDWLVTLGDRLRSVPKMLNGGTTRAWLQAWGAAVKVTQGGAPSDRAWAAFVHDYGAFDVGAGQDAAWFAPRVLRDFLLADGERGVRLANEAARLPVANVIALAKAAHGVPDARDAVFATLASDSREVVRRAVMKLMHTP